MFINNLFQSVFGQWSSNDQQTDINNNSTVFKWLTKEEESQIFSYADQKWKTYTEKKALVVDEYKRKLKEKYEIKRKQDRFEANTELEEKSLTSKDPVTSQTYKSIWRNWEVAESIRDYVTAWWKSEADDWKGVWNDDKWVIWLYISKNPEQSWAINEYINWNWEQYDFIQQMHWDRTPESKSVQEKEAREKELNSYNIQDIINWSTWTWVDYATMPYRLVNWPILWISEWSFNVARRIWNNIWDIWRIVKGDKSLAEKFNQILLWEVIWDSIWWGIWDFFAWGIEWPFKWFTTWEQRQALSNEVSWFIQNLMESDLWQDTLNWWNNLSDEQKQEAKDYLSYLDWYLNLIWLKWWKAAKPALEKWLNKVAWSLEDVGSDIGWAVKKYQVQNATKNLAENTAKANELAWRIVQWDIKAQWEAVNALKEIDTKWVKTYKDLWDRIWTKKKEIAKAVDEELAKDNTLYDGKTTRRVDMPDWSYQNLWQTPVHDAIKDLRELYSKLWDQEELLKLKYWEDKLNNGWLTKLEINNLAKQHGSEFSKKAFTEAWEPKWNDVWVKYETNRKAIKEYVRDLMPDDTTRNLDKMYHDLTDTEYYVKKMSEKVNTLTQKIKNRNLIEKFWAGLGDVINMVTWGWIKSFVTKFLPSNVWNKINNSLDMQRELPKLLEKLDNINKKIDLAKSKKDVKEIADDLKETFKESKWEVISEDVSDLLNPVVNEKTWETLSEAIEKLRKQWWAEEDINKYKDAVLAKAKWETYKAPTKTLDDMIEDYNWKIDQVWHWTKSDSAESILKEWYKSSSELAEDAYRWGWYGKNQDVISFSTDKKTANTFAKASWKWELLNTEIKDWAKIVKLKWVEYAEDLAEYLPELKKRWIDGVILDNWENELAIINRDIIWNTTKSQYWNVPKISNNYTKNELLDAFDWKADEWKTLEETIDWFSKILKEYDKKWEKFTLNNLLKNVDKYDEAKIEYDEFLKWMANEVDWTALLPSLKIKKWDWSFNWNGIARALEKAFTRANWIDDVTDIVRWTTAVKDNAWMKRVKAWLEDYAKKNNLDLKKDLDFDDKFNNPTNLWYKDLSFIYTTKNWTRAEVQINTPNMLVAKEWKWAIEMWIISPEDYEAMIKKVWEEWWKWHKFYEERRKIQSDIDNEIIKWWEAINKAKKRMAEIEKESQEYYKKFEDIWNI